MNNTGVKTFALCVLLQVFSPVFLLAQGGIEDKYNISVVNMESGLPSNYVDDMFIDYAGFLWISTAGGGLCRYDGKELISFSFSTTPSVKSTFVRKVTEDRFNRLWIASEGGLDLWNLRSLEQSSLQLPIPDSQGNPCCSYVLRDAKDAIWAKIGTTLYRMTFGEDGEIENTWTFSHPDLSPMNYVFKDVDGNGTVWAPLNDRLYKIIPEENGQTMTVRPVSTSLVLEEGTYVSDYLSTPSQIWISTENGLYALSRASGEWKRYVHDARNPRTLTQNFVTSLAMTKNGELLASTLHGLNIYNPVSDDFDHYGEDIINGVTTFGANILLGTENEGWKYLVRKQLDIKELGKKNGLSEGSVNAIWQDGEDRLWVGVVEGGLNILEPGSQQFVRLTRERNGLAHNSVSALRSGPDGNMYVGTWGGGIDLVQGKKPYRVLSHLPSTGTLIDFVGVLEYDTRNNLLWVGSNKGIFLYDPASRTYLQATREPVSGCIGSCIDRENRLWVGCQQGVFIFDLSHRREDGTFSYRQYRYKLDAPEIRVDEKISSVVEAPDGTIWLGSNGNGVYRAIPEADGWRFEAFSSAQGLSSNQVRGLCTDELGHIWVSTEHGLNRLCPETGSVVPFFRADGLSSDTFHWNNSFQGKDGLLYFGHALGVSVVNPSGFLESLPGGNLRFTSVSVGNTVYRDPFLAELKMHERDRSLRFHFSVLGMDVSRMRFTYCMEGFDTDWLRLPVGHSEVIYGSMPKGRYRFLVRATDAYGNPAGEMALPIVVRPVYYHTWWFYLGAVAFVLLVFWFIMVLRTRSLRRRQEELEKTVDERTREISAQKKLVEEKADELRRQNEVLLRQNEELASRKLLFAPERRSVSDQKEDAFMEKALETLRQHYRNPDLDVNTFCMAMGVSKTLLNSKLQESFGQSIGHFIRTYRLAVAKEMLESASGATVSEIAYEVGFNDPKYFTRCFAKEFGITPSAMGK